MLWDNLQQPWQWESYNGVDSQPMTDLLEKYLYIFLGGELDQAAAQ